MYEKTEIMKLLTSSSWGRKAGMLLEFNVKYIWPKIEYAPVIYGSSTHSILKRLEVIQNSTVEIVSGAKKTTPVALLLSESGSFTNKKKIKHAQVFAKTVGCWQI